MVNCKGKLQTNMISSLLSLGLFDRPDWEEAIQIPLGAVPCGSGNGMIASLLQACKEPFDITSACFFICKGRTRPLDAFVTKQGARFKLGFLCIEWYVLGIPRETSSDLILWNCQGLC